MDVLFEDATITARGVIGAALPDDELKGEG
jgi:hypothetical protein